MEKVFKIVPAATVDTLKAKVEVLFACQGVYEQTIFDLLGSTDSDQTTFLEISKQHAEEAVTAAEDGLDGVTITSVNLLKSFKEVDIARICQPNRYYDNYGANHMVENLVWSSDQILNTCDGALMDKVIEGLVGIPPLDTSGPLVLRMMLEIIMDVDDSALRSLTQFLQTLRMKDVAGENVRTVVSYLKRSLMILQNCGGLPTDIMGLLDEIMCSAECNELSEFMKIVYVNHKRKTDVIEPTT